MNSAKMSKFLVISDSYPQPDQASGDLRFFTLLTLLALKHQVLFCATGPNGTIQACKNTGSRLEEAGVLLGDIGLQHVLKNFKPDIVWFEFFHNVRADFLGLLQHHCPRARIVVDSVDVHFNRFEAQARLTGKPEDELKAQQVKAKELAAYAVADMVIAVSEDDRQLIRQTLPDLPVEIIPNIHVIPAFRDGKKRVYGELVFVGGFKHAPNVDAMLYFCSEVMPIIIAARPLTRLKIIGSHLPQVVGALANESIEVVGYVPDTAPYLQSAYVSVAPLRFGGGLKGKVGEAMAHGLPVVTTSFGAEGFALKDGEDLLVGDSAERFAAQVIALLEDDDLHERVARRGYQFIKQHYSVVAVQAMIDSALQRLDNLPPRSYTLHRQLRIRLERWYNHYIGWRIGAQTDSGSP